QFADFHPEERRQSRDDDQGADHDGQHGPADEQSRDRAAALVLALDAQSCAPGCSAPPRPFPEASAPSSNRRTVPTSRSCCTPCVTTWSPSVSSACTSTPSEFRWMICTGTRSTLASTYFHRYAPSLDHWIASGSTDGKLSPGKLIDTEKLIPGLSLPSSFG